MNNSQETAESLDHLAERARVGLAWVKLANLKYEPPLGRPSIPLQSRKIGALLDKFRDPGCFPNVQRNRIQAKISPSVLAQALRLSGVNIEDLQNTESLQKLEFPEGVVLTHTHGQHRLEAARLHTYPHNVWWAVDLLNEEDLTPQFDVEEQNRNVESIPHSDGTVFRFLEIEGPWKKGWCSKRVEVDVKAIEKRPALYKALAELRPFVGVWDAFSKGTLARINTLKIDHEIIHYLKWMLSKYLFIIDGDLEIAEIFDAETVKGIEARAPMVSLADREHIMERFREEKPIFSKIGESATRARLQQNVLAINGLIPSMKTFLADTLYLEDCLLAMKILIDPTTRQSRDSLRHMWHGFPTSCIVLEYADGLTQEANFVMEEEDQFQIAYIQIWMFAMRNYPRLTSLVPKTDSNHKVVSTGPSPEWQRKYAVTATALGFKSNAINRLLEEDPDAANVRDMLSKARPPDKFMYDVQAETHSHCELLRRIQDTQTQLGQDTTPVWTTKASKVKQNRRYGRPFERALEECKPYFFLHNMFREPPSLSGRYFTDLFVKRSMLQFFFRIPVLPVALSLRRSIDLNLVQERDNLSTKRLREVGVTKQHNAVAEQATAQRELEEENIIDKEDLSKAENVLAGHLEQIRDYEKRIGELQKWKNEQSQQYSDSARQSKETIEALKRTIEKYASASKTQIAREHEDGPEVASLRRDLRAQSELVAAFQSSLGKRGQEKIVAINLAKKITGLELNIQTQNAELKKYEQGATTLRMMNVRVKGARKTVEWMSSAIKGQLQLELDSQGSDCERQSEELSAVGEQFNEIDGLEKSIQNFITTYSQNNLVHDENEIPEWQKQVPGEQLTIEDRTGNRVNTGTPDLKKMLALVSRQARAGAESQRLKAERVIQLEEELRTACDATQRAETLRKEAEQFHVLETKRVHILETDLAESLRQQRVTESTLVNVEHISHGFKDRINDLRSDEEEKTITIRNNSKTLDMITLMIKQTRKGVEEASAVYTGRFELEQTYDDLSAELPFEDLPVAEQFNEIEELQKSIWNFITLYSQNNQVHNENEWQKQVPGGQLAIEDGTGNRVDTGTLYLKQMSLVSRRARAGAESQRLKAERVVQLEEELKTARDATQEQIHLVNVLEEKLDTATAEKKTLLLEGTSAIADLKEEAKRARDLALQAANSKQDELETKILTLEESKQVDANTLLQESERLRDTERKLSGAHRATVIVQEQLDRAKQNMDQIARESSSYWNTLKSDKNDAEKRLEASDSEVIQLKQHLESARQSVKRIESEMKKMNQELEAARRSMKKRDIELASLTPGMKNGDERIRSLRQQLYETNRLIGLEEEKTKLEYDQKRIRAARDEAKTSTIQDQGDLSQKEASVVGTLLRLDEQMVDAKVNILIYAKHKLRLENSDAARQSDVEFVLVEDLEKRFEKLRDKTIYCLVNKDTMMVEPKKYKDFLAKPESLADHGEFFYRDKKWLRKRIRGLNDALED
ncbi:hypothetical protein V490_00495 [Pseudogymnoascus sp. VKM F-3557]|nr:hypothetical protein V490_00495 [Pseudogymnoascus sp. VKM F-3557]